MGTTIGEYIELVDGVVGGPVANVTKSRFSHLQALVEILLLSGGTPYANFKDLAHAWGREKGFHHVLVNNVCERRGEVERKRRSDAFTNHGDEHHNNNKVKTKREVVEEPTMPRAENKMPLEI